MTDGANTMQKLAKLLNLFRFGCIAHSCNRLIQFDLLGNKEMEIGKINDVISKIRRTQRALVFRYNELQQIHQKDKHEKITLMLEEFNEINNIWECEEAFYDLLEEAVKENFAGLTSMSRVRWSCLRETIKCHLNHRSKKIFASFIFPYLTSFSFS